MNMQPVHYAPHHTGHLPLCGAEPDRASNGGLVITTMLRDHTTCFKCIDQYEERAATPEQIRALSEERDAIDRALADIEENLLFDEGKRLTLEALGHMLKVHTPWWMVVQQYRLRRAIRELRALTLDDLRGKR
jgi:hypothetical protein